MIVCTIDGKIIRLSSVACSDTQFYSSYWKNVYGVTFKTFGNITGKSLAEYAAGNLIAL